MLGVQEVEVDLHELNPGRFIVNSLAAISLGLLVLAGLYLTSSYSYPFFQTLLGLPFVRAAYKRIRGERIRDRDDNIKGAVLYPARTFHWMSGVMLACSMRGKLYQKPVYVSLITTWRTRC